MYYPILLSLIAAAAGVPAKAPEPTIRITLSNEGQYLPGDRAKVQVITRDDGYLLVFLVNPDGRLKVLFPLDPTDDNYVKGGKRYLLLGRGGREGFTVDAGGTGVVFAAVSLDPWHFTGYVQNDHWDLRALNASSFDDTEPQLVELAQGMAGGRFDYDIVNYTVASQVAAAEEPATASGSTVYVDSYMAPVGVVYGTGYYNSSYLYDPWYYSPYYNYGPYYPAWAYGPSWNWGWGCYGYCGGSYWGTYYPPYPTAVPYYGYSPYQKKSWDRTWNGSPVPYRPRDGYGYTATNSVVGAVPGIGVQQHASFRDRGLSNAGPIAGSAVTTPSSVPVSKGNSGNGGRRRDVAPAATPSRPASSAGAPSRPSSGTVAPSSGSATPSAVPSRPRATAPGKATSDWQSSRPEAKPARPSSERANAVAAPMPSVGTSYERRAPVSSASPSPTSTVPVSRPASEAPTATKATGDGRSSEPVLRRREPEQPAATAPAPAPRQDNTGQRYAPPDRGYSSPPPSSQPAPAPSGGGYSGGGGRATSSPPSSPPPSSAPPSAVSGGGRRH